MCKRKETANVCLASSESHLKNTATARQWSYADWISRQRWIQTVRQWLYHKCMFTDCQSHTQHYDYFTGDYFQLWFRGVIRPDRKRGMGGTQFAILKFIYLDCSFKIFRCHCPWIRPDNGSKPEPKLVACDSLDVCDWHSTYIHL
jgi:hypothetical protein